jgi:hypothetical protein
MTPAFMSQFCDEAYALADMDWINATGKSPAGLSIAQLEDFMQSLRIPPSNNRHRHRHHRRMMKQRRNKDQSV